MAKQHKTRRQFLKTTSLAAISASVLPSISTATPDDPIVMCDMTTLDLFGQGPFYTANPPEITDNQLASESEPGTRMVITGRVFNLDCAEYIPNTIIDVWHANDAGQYDNEGFNLRGKTLTNAQGFYIFETVKPGKYLNGNAFRPSHIHFKITPPGFPTLTTQLYFEGDPDLETDAASSVNSGNFDATHRIIPIAENKDGVFEGTWDIVIDGDGITGLHDIHIDKGVIYKTSPNPFTDRVLIQYGVFRPSRADIYVFDLHGRIVANLGEKQLSPEKYEAEWRPDSALPNGHYFIALKINDLQVHYLKVLLQR